MITYKQVESKHYLKKVVSRVLLGEIFKFKSINNDKH